MFKRMGQKFNGSLGLICDNSTHALGSAAVLFISALANLGLYKSPPEEPLIRQPIPTIISSYSVALPFLSSPSLFRSSLPLSRTEFSFSGIAISPQTRRKFGAVRGRYALFVQSVGKIMRLGSYAVVAICSTGSVWILGIHNFQFIVFLFKA